MTTPTPSLDSIFSAPFNDAGASARITLLNDWCAYRVEGRDAKDFLSRQLTCDLSLLSSSRSVHGAWLSARGRVLALMRVVEQAGTVIVTTDAAVAEQAIQKLRLFVLRADVRFERATDIALVGLMRAEKAIIAPLPTFSHSDECQQLDEVTALSTDPRARRIVLFGETHALSSYCETLRRHGVVPTGVDRWHQLDCEQGVARLAPQTVDQFVPQMLNLDRTEDVSFTKGCYPGQEIVARTQHLGRIKRRMYVARLDATDPTIAPGDEVRRCDQVSQSPGRVVLSAATENNGQLALCVLPIDEVNAGATYTIDGQAVATISEPPYGLHASSH